MKHGWSMDRAWSRAYMEHGKEHVWNMDGTLTGAWTEQEMEHKMKYGMERSFQCLHPNQRTRASPLCDYSQDIGSILVPMHR